MARQETLTVTRWFDPAPFRKISAESVTVRFSGKRLGVAGKPQHGDSFVQDEVVDAITTGDGPISVTARVREVRPGDWKVSAKVFAGRCSGPTHPAAWSLCRWRLSEGKDASVSTCLTPFASVPGLVRGGWLTMVVLGTVLGLAVQARLASSQGVAPSSIWPVSLIGIADGIAGAKVWFLIKHRGEAVMPGWCVQGFVVGFVVAAVASLAVLGTSVGVFLDAAAPGLFLGLAVGRVGCLFGGCCGGPPTGSRWGMWASDQRVGRRRIPTQLMESGLSLVIGAVTLAAMLVGGTEGGSVFVDAWSAYVICRQGILRLRAESQGSARASLMIVALATFVLVAGVVSMAVGPLP